MQKYKEKGDNMAVFKVEKTKKYTIMSNYHLRDKDLSLKAKGLLSFMLSLPSDWDYSLNGLCAIFKEQETAIKSTLRELKRKRYLIIDKVRNNKGYFEYVYNIYEQPVEVLQEKNPEVENLLERIFELYENKIMRLQDITKYTDRYIGKKVYSYLKEIGYSDIQLYHNITDTVNKTLDERKNLFTSSIYFRNANDKKNISDDVKKEMSELLDKLLLKFENEKFYYTMSVLYYIVRK